MGGPRLYDNDEAVDAAMRVLWRKGYTLTSMSNLYAALGLRPDKLLATSSDRGMRFHLVFAADVDLFHATLLHDVECSPAIRAFLGDHLERADIADDLPPGFGIEATRRL